MHVLALQSAAGSAGQIESIASTFGVDWPHLGAQIVSFAIVCGVLYALAYKPILRMLEARRQQIASGLANAEKIEELDINPLIVCAEGKGAWIADALLVLRENDNA